MVDRFCEELGLDESRIKEITDWSYSKPSDINPVQYALDCMAYTRNITEYTALLLLYAQRQKSCSCRNK